MHSSVLPQFRLKACSVAVASALCWSALVQAQDVPAPANPDIEAIQITGSRIQRDGYDTPTPVTVLGTEDIMAEAPSSIGDFVNTMPSIQGSATPANSSGALSNGAAGIAALNLRGLGAGRTLVLFDGQRSVVSATSGQVDTNTFPQALVERVEIVTGGASAAYGSDAIGGVVNFILDRDFTGIKTSAEYGETSYGDDEDMRFTFTGGTPFANGAGHILFNTEQFENKGVFYTTREWNEKGYFAMPNPDKTPGAPEFYTGYGVGLSQLTPGGLITSGALRGTYFGINGTVNQLAYGDEGGQWMRGGDWQYATSGMLGTQSLSSDEARESYFARASYEIAPDLEVFGQASYASFEGLSYYINPTDTNRLIQADNPFLPQSVRDALAAAGETSFRLGSSNNDMPASGSNNMRATTRYVLGIEGDFFALGLGFDWDAYYQKGITRTDELETPTWNTPRLGLATDATIDPATGEIVCRSTLIDPANGCVPLNRFGIGVASQEALDYVLGTPLREQEFQQDVVAINFSTSDIPGLAAGPISIAFGAEWREDSVEGQVDPVFNTGWKYGNYLETTGAVDVAEAYIETVVPLLDNLELNAATRYADYSTSGGTTTWKLGLTYQPIEDITLRLTRSLDIRSANLEELYALGTARSNSVSINGESVPFVQSLKGSTSIQPEEAKALGVGLIYQPDFFPGFQAAVDYYSIEVDGIIGFVGAENVANFCFLSGVQSYCDQLNYDQSGVLQTIDLYYDNLTRLEAEGMDLEASYSFDMDEMFGFGAGEIQLRAMATHYLKNIRDDGVTAINEAGANSGNTPDWSYRMTARYSLEDWSMTLTARGVSDGVVGNQFIECASNCPVVAAPYRTVNDNSVAGAMYFDGYLGKTFALAKGETELFVSIKNMLDTDPVLVIDPLGQGAENRPGTIQTNRNLYDVMGRNFRLGARYDF